MTQNARTAFKSGTLALLSPHAMIDKIAKEDQTRNISVPSWKITVDTPVENIVAFLNDANMFGGLDVEIEQSCLDSTYRKEEQGRRGNAPNANRTPLPTKSPTVLMNRVQNKTASQSSAPKLKSAWFLTAR